MPFQDFVFSCLFFMKCEMIIYSHAAVTNRIVINKITPLFSTTCYGLPLVAISSYKYSQTPLIRPFLIQLFANPAKNLLEQIFPYHFSFDGE